MNTQVASTTPEAERDCWRTPLPVFREAQGLIGDRYFDVDAAATPENALCPNFWTEDDDGLAQNWNFLTTPSRPTRVWVNPPFSKGNLMRWTAKAAQEAADGAEVVMLLPFVGDGWFHANVVGKAEIVVLEPRVRFLRPDGSVGPSPTGSVFLAHYRPRYEVRPSSPLRTLRWR